MYFDVIFGEGERNRIQIHSVKTRLKGRKRHGLGKFNFVFIRLNRTSIRDFSVRLFFENQAWRDATPFLLFVSVEVGNFYGSDEVVSNCLSGQKASIEAYEQTTFGVVGYTFIKRSACYVISLKI